LGNFANILGPDSRGNKLEAIGFSQVEKVFSFPRRIRFEDTGIISSAIETVPHILPHSITVPAYGRAECSAQRGWGASEYPFHLMGGFGHQPEGRASPTAMNCGNRPGSFRKDQDRKAVRGLDKEKKTRTVGEHSISFQVALRRGKEGMNDVGMNL